MKKLVLLALLAVSLSALDLSAQAGHTSDRYKIGVAGYTYRKFSIDQTLEQLRSLGIKYLSVKDFWLPLDATAEEIAAFREKRKPEFTGA